MRRWFLALVIGAGIARSPAAPPSNDTFDRAAVMSGPFWLTHGSLHGTSSESNEPILTGFPNGPTAWWRWKAPAGGPVRVRTWGSERRNVVAVYRGSTLDTTRLEAWGTGHFEVANSAEAVFTATAGETYAIQVLGADLATPVAIFDAALPSRIQLSLTPTLAGATPPPNDAFADAEVLVGGSADLVINTAGASAESGEPLDLPDVRGNTVWLRWTAPGDGTWLLDGQDCDHDNVIAVYTGSRLNGLTRIDYGDDAYPVTGGPGARGGRVTFHAVRGGTYHFQVQGASIPGAPTDFGNVRLILQPASSPPNDDFAAAAPLDGASPSGDAWTTFATREPGEAPAKRDETRSVWWRYDVPQSGLLAVVQYEGTLDPYTGTALDSLERPPYDPHSGTRITLGAVTDWYPVTAGQRLWLRGTGLGDRVVFSLRTVRPPANDDFADRKRLEGANASDTVDLEYASHEHNEPSTSGFGPQTVWYRWKAPATDRFSISTEGSPFFTRVRVYTGEALNALSPAGEERLYGFSPNAYGRVILDAVAGTEYALRLDRESIVSGVDQIRIRPFRPPPNDDFSQAIVMTGSIWTTRGNNADGTWQAPSEPIPTLSDGSSGTSIWWRWTAPATGFHRISTAGSAINTVLAVYTGTALESLTRVAQDQGSGWASAGSVILRTQAGETYQILVDGQGRQEGEIQLSAAPFATPANDAFASRLALLGPAPVASGTLLGATSEPGEPASPASSGMPSVWYEWTAPATGTAQLRVTGRRFDPGVGWFSGSTLAALAPLVSGGTGASLQREQTFLFGVPVTAGSNYKLLVRGAPDENGAFEVSITLPLPPAQDSFEGRAPLAGAVVHSSANNTGASRQAGEPNHAGAPPNASVWWEWTAPAGGRVQVDTSGSTAQPRIAIYTGAALGALVPVASASVNFPDTYSRVAFTASAGTRYVIAADSSDRQRGDIALNLVSESAAPGNDAFGRAVSWVGDAAEAVLQPRLATAEAGEPAHGGRPAAHSLWWRWTPSTSRRATVWMQTQGNGLLARLAIYKGSTLDSLVPLASQANDTPSSRLVFDALAGETYAIALDTPAVVADPGWVRIGIVPVHGTADNAAVLQVGESVSADTTGASNEDPALAPAAVRQLWWRWQPEIVARMEWRVSAPFPPGTRISVSTLSASFNGLASAAAGQAVPDGSELVATFDAAPGVEYYLKVISPTPGLVSARLVEAPRQVPPSNDQRYRAQVMTGASWSVPVTLGAESENRLYWSWTAPAAGVAEVSLTGALAVEDRLLAYADGTLKLTAGAGSTDGGTPSLRVASRAGQLWIFVTETTLRRLRPARLTLAFPAPGVPPANDSWEDALILPQDWSRVAGDVTLASCQPRERDHSASGGTQVATTLPPGRSVWFDWTPADSGPVTLRLETGAPLALRIYRGRTEPEWREEAFLPPGSNSLSTFLLAGQTYHLAVASRPPHEMTGDFVLHRHAAAPNDSLVDALVLSGTSASSRVDSAGATIEPGEPGHGFNFETPRASLWWRWTAPATGLVHVDTRGSDFDTILAVFGSDPPDANHRVAENDDADSDPGIGISSVVFPAVGGETYLIRVCRAENSEASGVARLHLAMGAPSDPYIEWTTQWPRLTGADAAEEADPDNDGLRNLAELAFGTNPTVPDARDAALTIAPADGGWRVEARIDRDAMTGVDGRDPIELVWELSNDLRTWQPGPPSTRRRREGRFSIEAILLQPGDPPFARIRLRRLR